MSVAGSPAADRGPTSDPGAMAYSAAADIREVRAFVRARASALGLPDNRVDLLTLAVSELATNTVQHSGSGGRVRVWASPGHVVCEVHDGGSIPDLGRPMPHADAVRGRGLAIVERICDDVSVVAGPHGSVIELRYRL